MSTKTSKAKTRRLTTKALIGAESHLGFFDANGITHAATFELSNGALLSLAKCGDGGWAFAGTVVGKTRSIAFSPEACDIIFGAMLLYRGSEKPAPYVKLFDRNEA